MRARVHCVNRGRGRYGPSGFVVEIVDNPGSDTCYDPALDNTLCKIVIRDRS
jgi:hypothetical protein